MDRVYDPLDYENLARSVVTALLEKSPGPIPPKEDFIGAGVYAIYYTGNFKPYQRITKPLYQTPIYVGQAIPPGARKGKSEEALASGQDLCRRLKEHAKSIEQAENLEPEDFACRFLVVMPVWISLAEQFLINHYRPIWNLVLEGFGNHPPGAGRTTMRRPQWDIVHPGRPWANRLAAKETSEHVLAKLDEFFKKQEP